MPEFAVVSPSHRTPATQTDKALAQDSDSTGNAVAIDAWREWLTKPESWTSWVGNGVGTAWDGMKEHPGLAAAGLTGLAAMAGMAMGLGGNKAEPTPQASTPQAPIPTPQAPTPTPQAPTPTHANTDTPRPTQLPLHAGVQVGRPDGSLERHIDGPTMGTRVSGPAAKRQRI